MLLSSSGKSFAYTRICYQKMAKERNVQEVPLAMNENDLSTPPNTKNERKNVKIFTHFRAYDNKTNLKCPKLYTNKSTLSCFTQHCVFSVIEIFKRYCVFIIENIMPNIMPYLCPHSSICR